jgi:hypothetical protein
MLCRTAYPPDPEAEVGDGTTLSTGVSITGRGDRRILSTASGSDCGDGGHATRLTSGPIRPGLDRFRSRPLAAAAAVAVRR